MRSGAIRKGSRYSALGPEHALNQGIAADALFVELRQILGARRAAGDHVAAEIDVVVVVAEERDVARQDVAGIEEHAVRLEVVGAALHVLSGREAAGAVW